MEEYETCSGPDVESDFFVGFFFFLCSLTSQVRKFILSERWPASDFMVMKLAGLSMQVRGELDPSRLGAKEPTLEDLEPFIPRGHLTRYRLSYWQARAVKMHGSHRGMSKMQAMQEYIQVAKLIPNYGTHLFVCKVGSWWPLFFIFF
jgi:hypothetical protein